MKILVSFTVILALSTLILLNNTTTIVHISRLLKNSKILFSSFTGSKSNQQLRQTPDIINGEYFAGTYYSDQPDDIYDYIESKEGHTLLAFYGFPLKSQIYMAMYIFDPFYHDGRSLQIVNLLDDLDSQDSWVKQNDDIGVTKYYKQRLTFDGDIITTNYTIKLENLQQGDPDKIKVIIKMQGEDIHFRAQLTHNYYPWATLGYTFFVVIYVIIQLIIGQIFLNRIKDNVAQSAKISLVSLALCCYMDISLSLQHFNGSFEVNILQTAAFLTYFYKVQLLLVTHVWKNTHLIGVPNREELKKKIIIFLTLFFLGIFSYVAIVEFFNYSEVLMTLQHCFMIPQIIHNARTGKRGCWKFEYIVGMFLSRFFLILYQRACPSNFGKLTQMPQFITFIGILYILQLLILLVQYKCGARFFIPRSLRPGYFEYHMKLARTPENEHLQCTICLQSIFQPQHQFTGSQLTGQSMIEQRLLDRASVMKTPCKHYFHTQCLRKWIQVKMQCPTCRTVLPAFQS